MNIQKMINIALKVDREMQDCSLVMLVTMHIATSCSIAFYNTDAVVITVGMQDFWCLEF